jgi:hypothetical protein
MAGPTGIETAEIFEFRPDFCTFCSCGIDYALKMV